MVHLLEVANEEYEEKSNLLTQEDNELYTETAIILLNEVHEQS